MINLEQCSLGIEFGSTRIKAVLVDESHNVVASGSHEWENRLENGIWTYSLEDVWQGLQNCYASLKAQVQSKYALRLTKVKALGISGMMHGYLAFDKDGKLLAPFKTWRNSCANAASAQLTEEFNYNIPERWSIAHLYQCMLNREEHVNKVDFFTTLSGYVHYRLTNQRVLGIGDAVGMFPINYETHDYQEPLLDKFNALAKAKGYDLDVRKLLPKVLISGQDAGALTEDGAKLIDPSGDLQPGIPMCAPEGDAATGMVATNAVAVRTGNVSAGTSIFAMIVLEHGLKKLHREIDNVSTPDGFPVAMVHANNGTSDLNAWVNLFSEFAQLSGHKMEISDVFSLLYNEALKGEPDCSGLMSYGYLSGEFITGLEEGRPMFIRTPHSNFTIANFMRSHLYSTLGAIKIGMDILTEEEGVKVDSLLGHGGLFKTKGVAQSFMASALNVPVSVMDTAGEGGPWGMAVLASYLVNKKENESLSAFLNDHAFTQVKAETIEPNAKDVAGYAKFIKRYQAAIAAQKAAVETLSD